MRALTSSEKVKVYSTFRTEYKNGNPLAIFNAIMSIFDMQGASYSALLEAIKKMKGDPGEKGADAVVDKNEILDELRDFIIEKMDKFKPADGYTPTESDLVPIIKKLIPAPKPGDPGKDADPVKVAQFLLSNENFLAKVKGKEGDKPSDKELAAQIKKLMPAAVLITGKNIISEINALPIESPLQIGIEHIKGLLDELRTIKKNNGGKPGKMIHGGGLTRVYHDGTLSGDGTRQDPLTVIGGGSGSDNFVDNEVVAGSGTAFTLAYSPVPGSQHIYNRGQRLIPSGTNQNYSISGAAITTFDTLSAEDIWADYRTIPGVSSFEELAASGLVNGLNRMFTFTEEPDFIVSDHVWYTQGEGWSWNAATMTATLDVPPVDEVWGELIGTTTELVASGTILPDGSQKVFSFTEKPVYIISDGAWYHENKGWTWNAGLLQATMTIGPTYQIYGEATIGSEITTADTVDGSNTVFGFAEKPTYIIAGGGWYHETIGWTWNAATFQATMTSPPSTDVWGL